MRTIRNALMILCDETGCFIELGHKFLAYIPRNGSGHFLAIYSTPRTQLLTPG
jgi:hypothetical protein